MNAKTLGRYRILGELGRGAMGAVFRAIDPLIEREVALKTLLPELPEEVMAEVRERFLREARSAGRLNHPNIVIIHDVGEQDGVAYIAMELLEGRSLQQMLKDPQRIPLQTTADLAAQIADALEHAHKFSIVHRDVKPANVMVAASGRCKLTDFGVAYVPSSTMTQTGAALGSPKYMSPEQVLGQKSDPRSDVFSLGTVLYEMLTGRSPFERPGDTSVFQIMNRIAGEPHPPLRSVDSKLPAGFERVVDRALAKRPEQRYQRAGDMAQELRKMQYADTAYDKTLLINPQKPAPSPLLDDLDEFTRRYDLEEQARLRAAEEERRKKEEQMRRWQEEEARKRAAYERERQAGEAARRLGAVEMLRKQGALQPRREDPAAARAKAMAKLDQDLRAATQYLAEFAKELNDVAPATGAPYDFLYLGRVAAATLSEAWCDSRPRRVEGKDYCEHVLLRFRVSPQPPARVTLQTADIPRFEQYLKAMKAAYDLRVDARSDFGEATRATFSVRSGLLCEVEIRADYEALAVTIDATNVRRIGKVRGRIPAAAVTEMADELARYALGVDSNFAKRLTAV